jgi:hypothetical protein
MMHWTRAGLALAGLAAAGLLTAAGCAPATQAAVTSNGVVKTGGAVNDSRAVHLIAYSINSDGPWFRAILTGAVGDYGPAVTVHPDGKIDPEHTSEMELRLRHGDFRLSIAVLDRKIVRAYQHWPSNARTCSGTIVLTAALPVVAGSGTGSYRGITGRFQVTATISEVDAKPCDGTGKFLSQVIMLTATGTVAP